MFNEYEASEILEIGKAEELILGQKDEIGTDEPGLTPVDQRFSGFASYED
jgi:hypothetical protein